MDTRFPRKVFFCLVLSSLGLLSSCGGGGGGNSGQSVSSACSISPSASINTGMEAFVRKDSALGLVTPHGFDLATWGGALFNQTYTNEVMEAGGITTAYINDDCWPDLLVTGGDKAGMVLYTNKGVQKGFTNGSSILSGTQLASDYKWITGSAIVDMNGDYQHEIVLGSLRDGDVVILEENQGDKIFYEKQRLPIGASIYGMAFGDANNDDYLDMFLSHWERFGSVEQPWPNLFWMNDAGVEFVEADDQLPVLSTRHFFAPSFVDVRNIGVQDLLLTSDYGTTKVLKNNGSGVYTDVTDTNVIVDDNGMGAAVGDIDNDGLLDWFVTAIDDSMLASGNRLYRNTSTAQDISFEDITDAAGVKEGSWGWGACMADFNHDSFLDIFHVNGYYYIPYEVADNSDTWNLINVYRQAFAYWIGEPPRLFINQGDGTFSEQSAAWGLNVSSEGRGISCFDYDRDGDMDIALLDHSTGVQFFENQVGNGSGKSFLNIHLIGKAPNTDAIGTKVFAETNVGAIFGNQRQMRVSSANSNFNGQNLTDLHFGLGEALTVSELSVFWTDGSGLLCVDVPVNQFLVFDERDSDWPKLDETSPSCTWHADMSAI